MDRSDVITAAITLLDRGGIETVTLRAIATHLDVRMNTVVWHTKSKARLYELMADAILAEISLDELPDEPLERFHQLAQRYRAVLTAHPDAARVVAGTYGPERNTFRFAEIVIDTLSQAGATPEQAATILWTTTYLILGLVQEQQGEPQDPRPTIPDAGQLDGFPALSRTATYVFGNDFDHRFTYGINCLLHPLKGR